MPAEAGIDESGGIPDRLIAQARQMGLDGYALPAEYGGLGLPVTQQVPVAIGLGYAAPAFSLAAAAGFRRSGGVVRGHRARRRLRARGPDSRWLRYIRGIPVERLYRDVGCSGSARAPARSSNS
jgi:hypothetical protein